MRHEKFDKRTRMSGRSKLNLSAKDTFLLIALTVLWGINWPIMKAGVRDFPPLTFRTLCMVGGVLVLALIIKQGGLSFKIPREYWKELLLIGLTNMVCWYVCSIYGVKLLSSGRAAILGYTLPIWTAIFGITLFKTGESVSSRLWFGVLSAAIGVGFLLAGEFGNIAGRPLGALLMLCAAASWAIGTHLMRRRKQQTNVVVVTFWCLLLSLLVSGTLSWLIESSQWVRAPNNIEWLAIAFNAVVVFGFCQVVWFRLATILPPVASGLSVMLIPVIGLFSGMWLLGEVPHWQDYVALASILIAIATVLR
jgi:drug/metabolite transporter (DMT)-like permease